jgi:prophage maintenance system killer protein
LIGFGGSWTASAPPILSWPPALSPTGSLAAQAFAEGNKRTALLAAKWILDRNGIDGDRLIPTDDLVLADLLVQAASGSDVETAVVELLQRRR